MNKHIFVLTLILFPLISGCVQNEGKTVYHSEKYNETITLYDDFTVTIINSKESGSGTYKVDGNHVILVLAPFGTVIDLTKQGNRLVDERDGDYWEKI